MLDCGHEPTKTTSSVMAGTASDKDGRSMCYGCAEDRERADLRTADRFFAYLKEDGESPVLTTWTRWSGKAS